MTCLALDHQTDLHTTDRWEAIRASVFWGFVLLVIVSPALLGAVILSAA